MRTFGEALRRSTVAHFACKVRGTNIVAAKHGLKIQQSHAPEHWPCSLRVRGPHFARNVSYSAGAAIALSAALRGLSPIKAFTLPANNEVWKQSEHKKSTLPAGGRAFSYVFLSSSLDEFLTAANINLSLLWRRDNATAEVVDDVVRNALRVGISRDKLNVRRDVRRFDIPERRGILCGR